MITISSYQFVVGTEVFHHPLAIATSPLCADTHNVHKHNISHVIVSHVTGSYVLHPIC